MPYITREDGEHFVIPSYRDVISAKQKATAKKEILLLSQSYGDNITLQKKGSAKYELAFSPDTGYLLGETVWHHFGRATDLIFCEAIPDTTEVVLVVVKGGSVYLDGSFPAESVAEELVVFLTQENSFEIYVHGDVPIGETPEEGKFAFEASSVKSFKVLDEPAFPKLPLLNIYKLQPVEAALKQNGIGVAPVKELVTLLGIIVVVGGMWMYLTQPAPEPVVQKVHRDRFERFKKELMTPSPSEALNSTLDIYKLILTVPGWTSNSITIIKDGKIQSPMISFGGSIESLMLWARQNDMSVIIKTGITLSTEPKFNNRSQPTNIYPLDEVIAKVIDDVHLVLYGNVVSVGNIKRYSGYRSAAVTIKFKGITRTMVRMLIEQLQDKPLSLKTFTYGESNGIATGSIVLLALGI